MNTPTPINGQQITSITTPDTSTPQTTTQVTFGDHTVSTTSTGTTVSTSTSVNSAAETVISQAESDAQAVAFSPETVVTQQAPQGGNVGRTATSANAVGAHVILGRTRTDSTSSSSSTTSSSSTDSSTRSTHTTDTEQASSSQASANLGSLSGLRGTEAPDGVERPDGPGGLPDMKLPTYDPTSKASIIEFLKNPSVQAKLQTKAGHIVFMDEARGSFIFVRNGDWSTAESIAVTNGRTKEPITDVKDLEMCIAKFCVGYETMQSDWENNIQPRIAGQTGETGNYSHLLMSMKFKTTVLYGPWNSKESSNNYTPSVWRRGTKVDSGAIWGDVGPLKGINWNNFSKPEEGTSFARETVQQQPTMPPFGHYPIPTINVNLGGIKTEVHVEGGKTTTTTTLGKTETGNENNEVGGDVQETGFDETDAVDTSSTIEEPTQEIVDEGPGEDDMSIPPPPPGPLPTMGGFNVSGMSNMSLQNILVNVRQHLDTVYDKDGNHHEGNQDLGTVVRTSENGTYVPTVLLNKNEGGDNGADSKTTNENGNDGNELINILNKVRTHLNVVYPENNGGEPVEVNQNLGKVIKDVESGKEPTPTVVTGKHQKIDSSEKTEGNRGTRETSQNRQSQGTEQEAELTHILGHVRAHLNVVYPESNGGEPIPVNQTLGKVIKDVESGKTPDPTKPETLFHARYVILDDDGNETTGSQNNAIGRERTTTTAGTSRIIVGQQGEGGERLEELLPQLRKHLDTAFDKQGNLIQPNKTNVGKLIQQFQERTGSGGIIATMPMQATVVTSRVQTQQSSITDVPQRNKETATLDTKTSLHEAARDVANSMSDLLSAATPATAAQEVRTAAPVTQMATSSPVKGTRQTATIEQRSNIYEAAQQVTSALSAVATKIKMFEQGTRNLDEAISAADSGGGKTEGQKLFDAAKQVTKNLSNVLDRAQGNRKTPPPPPPRTSSLPPHLR
ncbi:hypothetical protein CP10139811_0929 [Chlamydia ibidis]|uniref:DUF1547 domain-containing protein n=2 Tax=Chlamydia ibidis TaxID=1405396 RepID=S7J5R9_9CHLA|nr:type III secretion system actin-recruiting effector Tarp [Chlamydia ibidis]EPP35437.1 hypothetical protein CP10139811_0929 [Chlamydia ibidis]EQM62981.1 hypothetical protein H359_0248 [Chlamydia ibidis 10-1398/6]